MTQEYSPTNPASRDLSAATAAKWFWGCALGFLAIWTVIPDLVQPGYRFDVVEMIFVGKEWVLQTDKHPQFPAWVNEIFWQLTGGAYWTPFLTAQVFVLSCFYSIWRLARSVLGSEKLALLAVFSMGGGYWYYNYESTQLNANTGLMSAWAVSTSLFYFALKTDRYHYWIGLGLAIAAGFYSKYTMLFWVVPGLLFCVVDPKARRCWRRPGLYLTAGLAFALFLPHLIWLVRNDFVSIQYATDAVETHDYGMHFWGPFLFFFEQLAYVLPIIVILCPVLGLRWKLRSFAENEERTWERFLTFMVFGPFVLHLVLSGALAIDIVKNYGAQLWSFFSVFLLYSFRTKNETAGYKKSLLFCGIGAFAMIVFLVFWCTASPYLTGSPGRVHYPGRALAERLDAIWAEYSNQPCPYLTGDFWVVGNAALYMKGRPSVHFYWDKIRPDSRPTGDWSSDRDVREKGGLVVWDADFEKVSPPDYVREHFPEAETYPGILSLPYQTGAKVAPVRIGVAVIPPANSPP